MKRKALPPEDSIAGVMHKLYAHASWLQTYATTAQRGNWKDNVLYAARQAEWLLADLDRLSELMLKEAVSKE